MTRVNVFRKNARIVGFEVTGHTGYAEAGSDIVCSAVSALTQTAAAGVSEYLSIDCVTETDDGRLKFELGHSISDNECAKAEIILETMVLGLKSIADGYGKYLKIIEREV